MRICRRCGVEKPLSRFSKAKNCLYGRTHICLDCKNLEAKEWRLKNPEKAKEVKKKNREKNIEKITEYERAYREANRDIINAKGREKYRTSPKRRNRYKHYYASNREKELERNKKWVQSNSGYQAIRNQKRRANVLGNGGNLSLDDWRKIKEKYNFVCLCCGKREPEVVLTIDHVIPVSKGGMNDVTNIQPLCLPCNSRKNDKIIDYRPPENLDENTEIAERT